MEFLPQDISEQIPPLHTQETFPDDQLTTYARLTLKAIGLTWFLMEIHSDGDTFSAYLIDPQTEQFGYFSFAYLAPLEQQGVLWDIEVDQQFTPTRLIDAVREERIMHHDHGEGLPEESTLSPHRAYYYAFSYPYSASEVLKVVHYVVSTEGENLSVFHLLPSSFSPLWHIVVMGDWPEISVHEKIMATLSDGAPTTITYKLLMRLFAQYD